MADTSSASGGIGFFSLLGLLFIGLKLGGVIDWSWWWVLSPFWLPPVLFLGLFAIGFVIYLIYKAIKKPS